MHVLRAVKDIVTGDYNSATLSGAIDIIAVRSDTRTQNKLNCAAAINLPAP